MILYEKHLVLMSLALFLVPLIGRIFAKMAAAKVRMQRPGVTWLFALSRLLLALVIPLLAQGAYQLWDVRWVALSLAGLAYGALFGDANDFPPIPAALWGAGAGAVAAYFFTFFDPSAEARALCVAVFAVAPLLAYRPMTSLVRRKLASYGLITPSRKLLR